jgi:hypothetical protein
MNGEDNHWYYIPYMFHGTNIFFRSCGTYQKQNTETGHRPLGLYGLQLPDPSQNHPEQEEYRYIQTRVNVLRRT